MSNEAIHGQISDTSFNVSNHNTYTASKADAQSYIGQYFIPRNLSHFGQERFLSPQITQNIVAKVQHTHLLILASRPDLHADHLLMHVAWELHDGIQHRDQFFNNLLLLECNSNLDLTQFDLSVEIEKIGKPSIIMIPSASPQHLGWDLSRVRKVAHYTPHFIICSTTKPVYDWHLSATDSQYWHELPKEAIYDEIFLTDTLIKQLIANQNALPKEIRGVIDPDEVLFQPYTIRCIAKRLQTDTNISVFIQLLCADELIDSANGEELISLAKQSEREVIKKWFLNLPPREQLMALAISFFDGLVEEQVFSALQTLVTTVWMQSSTLGLFDYLELEKIRTFFPINTALSNRPRFQGIFPEQRKVLLKLAWDRYRVHIRIALLWLVQLVKNSMKRDANYLEIYGDDKQRDQLRNSVSETLGDIGLISADAVQDALLWLVADEFYPVQVVAARIMANWYKVDQKRFFFGILKEWRGKRAQVFIETALSQQYSKNNYNATDYSDSATLLAISYAAKHDQPNKVSLEIIQMLEQFIYSPSDKVIHCLNHYTVPMLLPLHLSQMRYLIKKMIFNIKLHKSLTEAFIKLHLKNEKVVLNVLRNWKEEAFNISRSSSNKLRDKSLAFIIRVLIAIWYRERAENSTSKIILGELDSIFQNENTNLVRTSIADAIMSNTVHNSSRFPEIEELLCSVVSEMNEQELVDLAHILPDYYLQERVKLKGGEDTFVNKLEKTDYDTWIETTRPSTFSEIVYYNWLTKDYPKKVQVLALYTSIDIAQRFELAEEKYRQKVLIEKNKQRQRRKQRMNPQSESSYQTSEWILTIVNSLFDTLMYWLATIFLTHYKTFIRRVLPEINYQYQNRPRVIWYLLNKWSYVKDTVSIQLYAYDIYVALRVMEKRRFVAIVLFISTPIIAVVLTLLYFVIFS